MVQLRAQSLRLSGVGFSLEFRIWGVLRVWEMLLQDSLFSRSGCVWISWTLRRLHRASACLQFGFFWFRDAYLGFRVRGFGEGIGFLELGCFSKANAADFRCQPQTLNPRDLDQTQYPKHIL